MLLPDGASLSQPALSARAPLAWDSPGPRGPKAGRPQCLAAKGRGLSLGVGSCISVPINEPELTGEGVWLFGGQISQGWLTAKKA
jgi:hypothetical protein